jgi:restriction system protein
MKKNRTRKDLNFLDFLSQVPWWVYISISSVAYFLLAYVVPLFEQQGSLVDQLHVSFGPAFAPVVALALLAPASFSLLNSGRRKKKLHGLQKEIQAIQTLSHKQFENLVAETYSRIGYLVLEHSAFEEDQGIDLVLRKSTNLHLVRCRNWQSHQIDLDIVKQMYSLMYDRQASGTIIITSGTFTREAHRFAANKPIELVDGRQLVELIGST